jgi:protein involved in polysaccharide export with SLBB domain
VHERPQVHITGQVRNPLSVDFRAGMTLRDLLLLAGGPRVGADLLRAEISRLKVEAVRSRETGARPQQTVEVLHVDLGPDFLTADTSPALEPWDRVVVRRLPWWELQRTVTVRGEVYYPGAFSLERQDETLTSIITRAGGLKPDAYLVGARVVRGRDGVGNIAIDLAKALAEPGSQHDIILQDGDEIIVPELMHTVKVSGEVGFPTSLVYEDGRKIDWYVERAGGYLEKADKGKTRVVYPNGMSLPNKGGSKVVAGSTIIVPRQPPPEGRTTLEVAKDITAIVAGLATVWLIVDRSN